MAGREGARPRRQEETEAEKPHAAIPCPLNACNSGNACNVG